MEDLVSKLQQQAARFGRLFAFAFLTQALLLDWSHPTRSAVISAVIASAETAFRQWWPAEKPSSPVQ